MSDEPKCPKCGAVMETKDSGGWVFWNCGSGGSPEFVQSQSRTCQIAELKSRLSSMTAERDADKLKIDQLECTLDDEEAGHAETLRLWNLAKGERDAAVALLRGCVDGCVFKKGALMVEVERFLASLSSPEQPQGGVSEQIPFLDPQGRGGNVQPLGDVVHPPSPTVPEALPEP